MTRPPERIETDQGPLYWYNQSGLIMHEDRIYAVESNNYMGGLMLTHASRDKIPVTLTYPELPDCQHYFFLMIQYTSNPKHGSINLSNKITERGIAFFSNRHVPGEPGYVPYKKGLPNILVQNVRLVRDWMRDIARKKIRDKVLALSMGMHPRLGAESPLLELGSDIFSVVASNLW